MKVTHGLNMSPNISNPKHFEGSYGYNLEKGYPAASENQAAIQTTCHGLPVVLLLQNGSAKVVVLAVFTSHRVHNATLTVCLEPGFQRQITRKIRGVCRKVSDQLAQV